MGDFQRGIAEIGWANLYVTPKRFHIMDFSDFYVMEPACFLMPRPQPYSGAIILILPLDLRTWLFGIFTLITILVFYLFVSKSTITADNWPFDVLLIYEAMVVFRESTVYTTKISSNHMR